MSKCSVCKRTTRLIDGIILMNKEHKEKAKGDFICWECWYSEFVEGEMVEDETTKTVETPQLIALRKAKERRGSR